MFNYLKERLIIILEYFTPTELYEPEKVKIQYFIISDDYDYDTHIATGRYVLTIMTRTETDSRAEEIAVGTMPALKALMKLYPEVKGVVYHSH